MCERLLKSLEPAKDLICCLVLLILFHLPSMTPASSLVHLSQPLSSIPAAYSDPPVEHFLIKIQPKLHSPQPVLKHTYNIPSTLLFPPISSSASLQPLFINVSPDGIPEFQIPKSLVSLSFSHRLSQLEGTRSRLREMRAGLESDLPKVTSEWAAEGIQASCF